MDPEQLERRVKAGRSSIHGTGLFAVRRHRRDAYIASFEGTPTKRNGTHVLWVQNDDGTETGIRGENALRYLNHSSKPNTEFRGARLYALRNIQPGEELTLDYGPGWDDED